MAHRQKVSVIEPMVLRTPPNGIRGNMGCPVCGGRATEVDVDAVGQVRGRLCRGCKKAVEGLEGSRTRAARLVAYLATS